MVHSGIKEINCKYLLSVIFCTYGQGDMDICGGYVTLWVSI